MTKNITIGVLVVALLILGSVHFSGGALLQGTSYQKESFLEGLFAGVTRQFQIDRSGNVSSSGALLTSGAISAGGTATANKITSMYSATTTAQNGTSTAFTLGPSSASTSTATTTLDITGLPTGIFAVGDTCLANLNVTSTAGISVNCTITSVATTTASTTVTYRNAASSTQFVPTSTVLRYRFIK
jgi:putative surface-exposed virulence protein